MSVNLNISLEIHNIKHIHESEDESKRDEVFDAAKKLLEKEGILDQDMILDFLGQEGHLAAYNAGNPLIISRSHDWVSRITKEWEEMAISILGDSCKPIVNVEYPDEESEDDVHLEKVIQTPKNLTPKSSNKKPWWKFW